MQTQPISLRRRVYDRGLRSLLYLSAALTVALLVFLIGYIFVRGLPHVSWGLLSTKPRTPSASCPTSSTRCTWWR